MIDDKRRSQLCPTHPWITFQADLSRLSFKAWLQLGECASKCEHVAGVPLRPETERELRKLYLARGVQATTAIEGNTLSEEEVRRVIDHQLVLPPSRKYLGQEIENIVEACGLITSRIEAGAPDRITPEEIQEFNRIVLKDLTLDDPVVPGEFRTRVVTVGGYVAPNGRYVEGLVEALCEWLNGEEFRRPEFPIVFGILKAIVAHLYIAWIHPFGDGNGRTARLLEFDILARSGIPTPGAHLLSNHYNLTRAEYYRQLNRASKKADVTQFVEYAVQGFRDGLREQLKLINAQVFDTCWRNFVYTSFGDARTTAERRQRRLVLDLSKCDSPVPRSVLRTLSEKVSLNYARRTDRTLTRDLNELVRRDLIVRESGGYRAKKEIIRAFLPLRSGA